jgi:hypothetical protein
MKPCFCIQQFSSGTGLLFSVADAIPRYDIARTRRAAVAMTSGSQGRTTENCVAGEEARKDLRRLRGVLEKRSGRSTLIIDGLFRTQMT